MMLAAQDQALAVLKSHGRSFYFASQLLSPIYRSRAARLYAFCRFVDDIADESSDQAQANHDLEQIKLALKHGHSPHSCVADMLDLMQETNMPIAPVCSLIDGMQSDLKHVRIEDEDALLHYAYQVAGTVGLMMCFVLDVRDQNAWPFAIDLGIGMQLTNIARDVGQDAKNGRIYLPATWQYQLVASDIVDPNVDQKKYLQTATERILTLAEFYYRSGLSGVGYLPPAARYGIIVAARVYREIGQKVAQAGYQSWDRRAVVSQPRKVLCAASALVRYAMHHRMRNSHPLHERSLHRHLQDCFGCDQAH
jgi:phytoene synthase